MSLEPAAGFTDFLTANSPLLAWMHGQSDAARWDVSSKEFAAALYASANKHFGSALPAPAALEAYLRGLHLADMALACALRKGSEAAWAEFINQVRPRLYAAARTIVGAKGEAAARDLADSLYAELYGLDRSSANRRPLLDYFHGRSKLTTWLRAVLAQKFVDSLRGTQRLQPLENASISGETEHQPRGWLDSSTMPDVGAPDRERLIPHLRHAFAQCLAELLSADRLLLSLYYVQQLTLAQIARLRGVHEATVSRQLAHLRRELRVNIESALLSGGAPETGNAGHPGLSPAEVRVCFAYALEDWPFDLSSELIPGPSSQSKGDS